MPPAWLTAAPLSPAARVEVRRRLIFECGKWDPQVGDQPAVADYPIILPVAEWNELCAAAEALYRETLALETALRAAPHLHRTLALPWRVRRALAAVDRRGAAVDLARVMRFDFHRTAAGWRISEVNSDVPGGFIEAGSVTALMAEHYPALRPAGDPAAALADALAVQLPAGADVALVHATAYTDDRQVMTHLARRCAERGLRPHLASPDDVRWVAGQARLVAGDASCALAGIVRFFPAEWLPNLPRSSGWPHYFAGGRTPQCNPATALLTQSKRVPLVWDRLDVDVPNWRRLLPETRGAPDVVRVAAGEWVLKPALGRVGEAVGIAGVTPPDHWRQIVRAVRWWPRHWIMQRRFEAVPLPTAAGAVYPCIGVFVIAGRAAGAYGRVSGRPLIDDQAQDAAVLIADDEPVTPERRACTHVTAGVV